MCYNIAFTERKALQYAERYKDVLPVDANREALEKQLPLLYFVSGFEHPQLPIVKHDGIFIFEWGLIPSWVKDLPAAKQIQEKTLNARGETVFEKPSFSNSITTQRCLLGITGFYEWRDINNRKYPYFIHSKKDTIFSLGCIYSTWVDGSTGEEKNTFSIITTNANPLMEKIHNLKKRMPLILSRENEKSWIEPNLSTEEIKELITSYKMKDLVAFKVSQRVNYAKKLRNIDESFLRIEDKDLDLT